jgi:hypothetical protein
MVEGLMSREATDRKNQIPPDLVVKSQVVDISEVI